MTDRAPVCRVGLLGAGYIADWHAKALRTVPGADLVAVCDRAVGRAEALAAGLGRGRARAFGDLDAMIAAGGLDVVHVLLPPDLHAEAGRKLIEAGIHVLLEKPMATDAAACDDLIGAARARGVRLGVGHNFLFSTPYDRLRADLASGWIGRPERIIISWRKPLEPVRSGPFDLWMLRDPANILLEIGPHLTSALADLAAAMGTPSPRLENVRVSDPVDLPTGVRFHRRWQADADVGPARASLEMAFGPGFSEHSIQVRGTLGSAVADFERDTYILRRHSPADPDFDRYNVARAEAAELSRQAGRNLRRFALATLKLARDGKPYEASIARALRAFYGSIGGAEPDPRISPETGRAAVAFCQEIGARLPRPAPADIPGPAPAPEAAGPAPEALVLGGTGFIGRELVGQLLDQGIGVRVLARNPGRVPASLRGRPGLEITRGDTADPEATARAMEGIRLVYHLVVTHGKTWSEYLRNDVEITRRIGEDCLKAGVGRLVYTGTIDSYYNGRAGETITEETPLDPKLDRRNKYARAKAAGERALMELHRDRGLPVVIARPALVVGRGGSPFHVGVAKWPYESLCQLWGEGNHPLPFVLVEDLAAALVAAGRAPGIDGQAFNLSGPHLLSAREYAAELGRAAGARFRVLPSRAWKFYAGDLLKWAVKQAVRHPERPFPSYRDWDSRSQRARYDCSKAARLLGWKPTGDRADLIRRGIDEPAAEFLG